MRERYSEHFLSHVLWLQDEFATYYVRERFRSQSDALGIALKTFYFHRQAFDWIRNCVFYDSRGIRNVRRFLDESMLHSYPLYRMDDFEVMDVAARIIMDYNYPIVIRPEFEPHGCESDIIDKIHLIQNGEPLHTIFDNDSAFGKAAGLMNSGYTEFLEWLRKDRGQPEVKLKGVVLFEARPPKAKPPVRIQDAQWPLYKHSKAGWTDFWTYPKVLANAIIILIKTSLDLLEKALEHPVNELLVEPVKQLVALYKKMADPKKPLRNIVYPVREHRALVGTVIPEWKDEPREPWPCPEEAEQVLAILIALWIAKKYVDPKMAGLRQSVTQKVMNSTEKVRGKVKNELAKTQQHIQNRSADNVGPKTTKRKLRKPPASLNEAIERLGEARKRLASGGFKPKYTDSQLKAMAAKGEVNDRFVVRFMESKYAKSDGYLGPMNDGKVRYWSTTFDQIENADTDPKRISESLGLDYDPSKEYKLAVIDTADAAKYGDSHTIIPTHEKLGEFAASELKDIPKDNIPKVMNDGYSDQYARAMEVAKNDGVDITDIDDLSEFSNSYFSNQNGRELFKTRATIQNELGANEYFTGNGLTAYKGKECGKAYGTVETFTFDKNPQTIGNMMSNGRMKLLDTSPVP